MTACSGLVARTTASSKGTTVLGSQGAADGEGSVLKHLQGGHGDRLGGGEELKHLW
eukprot:CAMPEP_0172045814 /NCGR_PEP_ID=MMETSP1043-20130122/66_1 /TAXON_ID=464988 /ORGANISM="Hemiselmis andersenii, Strain CCMP441" /LENGTH=55 /DNA_ID=CAMNT_0012704407 /DNA_START=226 /DNA_END=390 /DNA_ORIENTATION=+